MRALTTLLSSLLLAASAHAGYRIETVVGGLEHPWALAFLPDGGLLVTERAGRLRQIDTDGRLSPPIEGLPPVYVASQGGLLDVLVDPDFADNQRIFLSYAHGHARANSTRLASARLVDGRLRDLRVLFESRPAKRGPVHYGGRLLWLGDGSLLLGLGDGFTYREQAQRLDSHLGTIVRISADGTVPADNPFVGRRDALPEIFSYGHRNVQGLARHPKSGRLYAHEHGPRGGDELNLLEPGANYGWPVATHGIDYSGATISPFRSRPGMRDPLLVWTPAIAPAGLAVYRGAAFPDWDGDLLIAGLVARAVLRVRVGDDGARELERLFGELGQRIRDVRVDAEGLVWLLTDARDGAVLRVRPEAGR